MPNSQTDRTLFNCSYLLFLSGRFLARLATGALTITIAWEVYEKARETMSIAEASLAVGMIGLAQFLPQLVLTLAAGETADRHNRRSILMLCYGAQLVVTLALVLRARTGAELWWIFVLAALFGSTRAFYLPTVSALGPMLVPPSLLPRAIATNSLVGQLAGILGPAVGGLICSISPTLGYELCLALFGSAGTFALFIRGETQPAIEAGRSRVEQIQEGLAYVWGNKLVLGAISLDLFAVLLGGATGLLPVYARDILKVGPEGFGVLRSAPAIGALIVTGYLALRPITAGIGIKMLLAVALFGLMTLVFAYSTAMWLSVLALAVLGGADMVSVFTRQSLIQIATPDRMRGRVSAVSTLFIGASNELGEFESGVTASFMGPVGAVAFGGAGSLVVTALWAWLFPTLRKADRLN
jgi:MFS family permease